MVSLVTRDKRFTSFVSGMFYQIETLWKLSKVVIALACVSVNLMKMNETEKITLNLFKTLVKN
jgi:hypothetical protein